MPKPMPFPSRKRRAPRILLSLVGCVWLLALGLAVGAEGLDACTPEELRRYLTLAEASEMAYDDSQSGLESTPSGCVALIREDREGNLIIAFRGSMLGDRNPKHRFSNLGGRIMRRNYRDWVATNLKQVSGFLPRQYVEAAALVEEQVRKHPLDKLVFVTGHSKGGGAATYAFVAANLSAKVSKEQAERLRAVTFNAAVVRERNWRRLQRRPDRDTAASAKEPPAGSIIALCMRDDPVSKIARSEERSYVKRISITPATFLTPNEQHGINAVIGEIARAISVLPPRQITGGEVGAAP